MCITKVKKNVKKYLFYNDPNHVGDFRGVRAVRYRRTMPTQCTQRNA